MTVREYINTCSNAELAEMLAGIIMSMVEDIADIEITDEDFSEEAFYLYQLLDEEYYANLKYIN